MSENTHASLKLLQEHMDLTLKKSSFQTIFPYKSNPKAIGCPELLFRDNLVTLTHWRPVLKNTINFL